MAVPPEIVLTINPETGFLEPTGPYPAGVRVTVPNCPVCGTPINVSPIDVTESREAELREGRIWIFGPWECPHNCNPMTGERVHFGQSFRSGPALPGQECTCTCGDVTVCLDAVELRAWQIIHHPPGEPAPEPWPSTPVALQDALFSAVIRIEQVAREIQAGRRDLAETLILTRLATDDVFRLRSFFTAETRAWEQKMIDEGVIKP